MNIATSELEHLREEVKNCHRIIQDLQKKREFVGLTEQERNDIEDYCEMMIGKPAFDAIEAKLKQKNGFAEENT